MLIVIYFIIYLNIPKVWLKPLIVESLVDQDTEFTNDDLRSKRETQLYELIHQAIEKYANCANEHLAPLKAWANQKQYETFIYPQGYSSQTSQNSSPLIGSAQKQNPPYLKCTKVNLCSPVVPQDNSNLPLKLGNSQDLRYGLSNKTSLFYFNNSKNNAKNLPHNIDPNGWNILFNPKYQLPQQTGDRRRINKEQQKSSMPNKIYFIKPPGQNTKSTQILGSIQKNTSSNSKESIITNTDSENSAIAEKSLKPSKPNIIKPPGQNTKSTQISGSTQKNMSSNSKESIITNTDSENSEIAGKPLKPSKSNTTESVTVLDSHLVLNETKPKPTEDQKVGLKNFSLPNSSTSGDTENLMVSSQKTQNCDCPNNSGSNDQNLNVLFFQMDYIANHEKREDLKQILKKLRKLQAALRTTQLNTKAKGSDGNTVTNGTALPTISKQTSTKTSKDSSPLVAASEPEKTALNSTKTDNNTKSLAELKTSGAYNSSTLTLIANQTSIQTLKDSSFLIKASQPGKIELNFTKPDNTESLTDNTESLTELKKSKSKESSTLVEAEGQGKSITNSTKTSSKTLSLTKLKDTDEDNTGVRVLDSFINLNSSSSKNNKISANTKLIKTLSLLKTKGNNKYHHQSGSRFSALNRNLNRNRDSIVALTGPPALNLNITNEKDLQLRTNEMKALVSHLTKETLETNARQSDSKSEEHSINTKTKESSNSKALSTSIENKTFSMHDVREQSLSSDYDLNYYLQKAKLSSSGLTENDSMKNSTITIFMSGNGKIKNIHIEHKTSNSSNKNLEINEKENMNLDKSSPKTRSVDMKGINSKFINIIKNPQVSDPYAEPILSEIYSSKKNINSNLPLSIYLDTIEETPSRDLQIQGNWKTYDSEDFEDDDDEDVDKEDEEYVSTLQKNCNYNDESCETEDEESEEVIPLKRSNLNKRNSYIT